MKEGDIIIPHGANWFGVFKVNELREISFGLVRRADYWEYWEYHEPEEGEPIGPRIFEERIEAPSREIAVQAFNAILNRRHPPPETATAASKEAVRAREAALANTDFREVLTAIQANDPVLAAKLFDDFAAANSEPHDDDTAPILRLRRAFKQRKRDRRSWHFLLVAHWDELPRHRGEIALWLERHGERGVSTDAVAKFMQRLAVKTKKTTK